MSRCLYTTGTRLKQPLDEVPDAVTYFRRLARSRLNDGHRLHVQHRQQALSRDLSSTFSGNAPPDAWSPWAGSPLAPPRIARRGLSIPGVRGLPAHSRRGSFSGLSHTSSLQKRAPFAFLSSQPPSRAHKQMALAGIGSNVLHKLPAEAAGNSLGHHGAGLHVAPETVFGMFASGSSPSTGHALPQTTSNPPGHQ